jgi:hypothetical protein
LQLRDGWFVDPPDGAPSGNGKENGDAAQAASIFDEGDRVGVLLVSGLQE